MQSVRLQWRLICLIVTVLMTPHTLAAQSNCETPDLSRIDLARCRMAEAMVDVDVRRRSATICETLLMVSRPPIKRERACLRARALNELGRYNEAIAAAEFCDDHSSEMRKLLIAARKKATHNPAVRLAFPDRELNLLTVKNELEERVVYCRTLRDHPEFDMEIDAPDTTQVEFTLEAGRWTIEAVWRHYPKPTIESVDLRSNNAPTFRGFGIVDVELPADIPATVIISAGSEATQAIKREPVTPTDLAIYSAVVRANRTYAITVKSVQQTWRETGLITTAQPTRFRPSALRWPLGSEESADAREHATWLGSARPAWLGLAAAGLVVAGGALIPWEIAGHKAQQLKTECSTPGTCPDFSGRLSTIASLDNTTTVLLSVGIVALIAGSVVAYWPSLANDEHNRGSLTCGQLSCRLTQGWTF